MAGITNMRQARLLGPGKLHPFYARIRCDPVSIISRHSIKTVSYMTPLHCVFFAILKSTAFHPCFSRPGCTGNSTYFHSPATVPDRGNEESAFRLRLDRLPIGEPLTVMVDERTELKPARDIERIAAGAGVLGSEARLKRMLQTPTSP